MKKLQPMGTYANSKEPQGTQRNLPTGGIPTGGIYLPEVYIYLFLEPPLVWQADRELRNSLNSNFWVIKLTKTPLLQNRKVSNGFFLQFFLYVSFSRVRKCERIARFFFHENLGLGSPCLRTQKLLTWLNKPWKK